MAVVQFPAIQSDCFSETLVAMNSEVSVLELLSQTSCFRQQNQKQGESVFYLSSISLEQHHLPAMLMNLAL